MKLSSRVGLIVIVVIIVAALIGLYVGVYLPQARERSDLTERRDRAQTLLPGLTNNKEDLEGQLASAQSSLDASQARFPASVESIEYGEYIFQLTEKCSLQLATLNFPGPTATTLGGVTYYVVALSLPVSGTLENIFKFLDLIKTDPRFASTRVRSVNLAVGGGSATIAVDIYSYQG